MVLQTNITFSGAVFDRGLVQLNVDDGFAILIQHGDELTLAKLTTGDIRKIASEKGTGETPWKWW